MRVIAGSAKGIRLAPVARGVRPVSDRAREGVFSSVTALVPGARVLDLFAGSGAMAIEALSRGAELAVLVERSKAAVRAIEENLRRTHLADRAEVVRAEVLRVVTGDDKRGGPFDLVLADPPYDTPSQQVDLVLEALSGGWLAERVGTLVLTRSIKSSMPVIPVDWAVARCLEYGDTLVLVIREA